MKNIKILIITILFYSLFSCEKLDKFPLTSPSEATFLEGPDDLSKAVAATYAVLQSFSWQLIHFEAVTNNGYARSIAPTYVLLASGQHTPTNGPQGDIWTPAYQGIQRANFVLQNIDKAPAVDLIKKRTVAEIKVLRAFFYLQLVNYFGDVPLVTTRLSTEEYNTLTRSSSADVYKFIIQDLDDAIPDLPIKYDAADYGRMTKGAALGLKARAYLYESNFKDAEIAAKAVMDLAPQAGYALAQDYRGMFLESGEASSEAVLDIQFLYGKTTGQSTVIETQIRAFLRVQGLYNLFDLYENIGTTDGPSPQSPNDIIAMWASGKDPFKGKDPRLNATIDSAENFAPSTTKLDVRKGSRDGIVTGPLAADRDNSGANWMAIRYADILLMFAEAHNENVGPDIQVQDAVNAVRYRASPLLLPVGTNLTQDSMRNFIRQERRKEFAFEGLWYNDIRRWGKVFALNELNKDHYLNNSSFIAANYDKFNLLPIPQNNIDIDVELTQNPGYQ